MLARFTRRLAQEPDFISTLLQAYIEQEGLDDQALAAQLGIDLSAYHRLAMCRQPRRDHFARDIQQIATFVGADMTELLRVLRQANAVQALQHASPPETRSDPAPIALPQRRPNLLAAARDREQAESEPLASGEIPPADEALSDEED
jgi:hypothetical protein